MRLATVIRSLGPIDVKSVWRDSLLRWMVFLLPAVALFLRAFVPFLTERTAAIGFDLVPLYPFIISYFFVLLVPLSFGMVIGFLLLDERDANTLAALQVSPLTMPAYLTYRIGLPMLLSMALMVVVVPLSGLVELGVGPLVLVAAASALQAPLFALFIASVANNKVQGFALMKGLGALLLVPLAGFFVRTGWQWAFGLMPTFWPAKLYWQLQAGETNFALPLVIGLLYQIILLVVLLRRFERIIHR